MNICSVCKQNKVTLKGCVTCSLECATMRDNEIAKKQNRPSDTWDKISKELPNECDRLQKESEGNF